MSLVIRMKRMGKHKAPFYRIVAAESRRDAKSGPYIEELGYYDPSRKPAAIKVDAEKVEKWVEKGATFTDTAKSVLKKTGAYKAPAPKKKKKKKKAKAAK